MTATAKKMLSVFMAFVLVFTLTPTVAFGGSEGEGEGGTDEAALQTSSTDEKPDGADTFVVNDTPADKGDPKASASVEENGNDPADEKDSEADEQPVLILASEPEVTAQDVTAGTEEWDYEGENYTLKCKTCTYTDDNGDSKTGVAIVSISASQPNTDVTIPSEVADKDSESVKYDVVSLGLNDSFSWVNSGNVKSLTIPSSVKYVSGIRFNSNIGSNGGSVTFKSGSSITILDTANALNEGMFFKFYGSSVTLPDSLTTVAQYMFQGSSITSISLPASVRTIDAYAFMDTGSLGTVVLNNGLTAIGANAFAPHFNGGALYETSIPDFETITIPSSVTSIGVQAFAKNTNLKSVTFNKPSSSLEIGEYAFYGTSLTSVNIPDGVTEIGKKAFSGRNSKRQLDDNNAEAGSAYTLKEVTLGNNVTNLGSEAFAYQPIESIALPNSLTSLGYQTTSFQLDGNGALSGTLGAFSGCDKLTSITWPTSGSLTTVGGFDNCTSLTGEAINSLPSQITRIDDYAFYNCTSMDNVIVPKTVSAIGKGAFSKSSKASSTGKTFTLTNKSVNIEWTEGDVSTGPWPLGCGYTIKYPRGADSTTDIIKYRTAVETYEQDLSADKKTKFETVNDNFYTITGTVPAGASVRLYVNGKVQEYNNNSFTTELIEGGSLVGAVVSLDGYKDYTTYPETDTTSTTPTGDETDSKVVVAELNKNWNFTVETSQMARLSDLGILQVTGTGPGLADCNIAVFDSNGKLVSQGGALRCSESNLETAMPLYVVDDIPEGTYTVVAWQANEYFSRISNIKDLTDLGFTEGTDFAKGTGTVTKGETTTVELNIPTLDTSKISNLLAAGDVTIASYYNPIEAPFVATVKYNMTAGQSVDNVQVSIPDGLVPLSAATTATRYFSDADNINTSSWSSENHVLTIGNLDEADKQSGKITLSLKATQAGSYAISATVKSGNATAPLGGATVECPEIRLVAPEGTLSSKTFTVHVYAKPSSEIDLKIGNTALSTDKKTLSAACKTNLLGHAKVDVTIPDEELSTSPYYLVTATLKTDDTATGAGTTTEPATEAPSDTALVEYNSYLDDVALQPTVRDFWFESAGRQVDLAKDGQDLSGRWYLAVTTRAAHQSVYSTTWPFTAVIDSLQPLGDETTLYLGMMDTSVKTATLQRSGEPTELESGALRYTFKGMVTVGEGDELDSSEIPCRFDVMPEYVLAETVQPTWTSSNLAALKLAINTDVTQLENLGKQGVDNWYSKLNDTAKQCISGEYFYTKFNNTTYGNYKYYNQAMLNAGYDYIFGVFNESFRHQKWDPENKIWPNLSPEQQAAFEQAEDQVAAAYDALALLLGDSKPMYAYASLEDYIASEYEYTSGGAYTKAELTGDGYLVIDDLFDGDWTAVDLGGLADYALTTQSSDDLALSAQSTDDALLTTQDASGYRIGSFKTKDGRGEAANKRINGKTNFEFLIDMIKETTDNVMNPVRKVSPSDAAVIDGYAAKAVGLLQSVIDPIDDEFKSRSDFSGINAELTNRREELARMQAMVDFYHEYNPQSRCLRMLEEEMELLEIYINDLEWARRVALQGEVPMVIGGGIAEYTDKFDGWVKDKIESIAGGDSDARLVLQEAWGLLGKYKDGAQLLSLVGRQMCGAKTALISTIVAPNIAKHRQDVQTFRFDREEECKTDAYGKLHYHVNPIIDPSGYTYEGVKDNRVEGVTATIYQYVNNEWVKWDAENYDEQENPQTTTAAGLYAWNVPEGDWKVLFQKEGYKDTWSAIMHVLPEATDVAINMLRKEAPEVSSATGNADDPDSPYVDITFNQFMKANDEFMPSVAVDGKTVAGAYWVNVADGTDENNSDAKLARVLRVPLAGLALPGDFVTVSVSDATSYAGVKMAGAYTADVFIPDGATYYYVAPDAVAAFTKGSGDALTFTFKRSARDELTFPRFQGILVDGAEVGASNYTAVAGSVVVTLKTSYLETLAEGDHTLTAQFEDGSATADFKVAATKAAKTRAATPATGDRTAPMNALLLTAAIACVVMLVARNRANAYKPTGKHTRR